MPTKKLADAWKPLCFHPEHRPPSMRVYSPGVYEHTCPACGRKMTFTVPRRALCAVNWGLSMFLMILLSASAPGCSTADVTSGLDGSHADGGISGGDAATDMGIVGDAWVPPGTDAGPGVDAWSDVDAWVMPGTDAGAGPDDAWTAPTDAWTASGVCGNGVLDPGEVCDPGLPSFVDAGAGLTGDGGVFPRYAMYCPSCTAVTMCPSSYSDGGALIGLVSGTGTAADNRCLYVARTTPFPYGRQLSWATLPERDAYFAVIDGWLTSTGAMGASALVALHDTTLTPITACARDSNCATLEAGAECVISPGTTSGTCRNWHWTSGPAIHMPGLGLPIETIHPTTTTQSATFTFRPGGSVSMTPTGITTGASFVILDPPSTTAWF